MGKSLGNKHGTCFLVGDYPRAVLKQVWDLFDQDNASMLSLGEFCITLYLMKQHREGRVLSGVLPSIIMLDLPTPGEHSTHHSTVGWGNPSGFQPLPVITGSCAGHMNPTVGRLPKAAVPQSDEVPQKWCCVV